MWKCRCDHCSKTEGLGFVVGQRSSGTGELSVERPTKPHPPCPLGADGEERWKREGSKCSVVRTWISGPAQHFPHHLRPWRLTVNLQFCSGLSTTHLLESGDLKQAFLSGDPDPAHKESDAFYIHPPSDLKRWLNGKSVETAKGNLWPHQCTTSVTPEAQRFVTLQMDPCVWILNAPSPVESVSTVEVPTELRTAVADSSVSPVPEIPTDR